MIDKQMLEHDSDNGLKFVQETGRNGCEITGISGERDAGHIGPNDMITV